MNNFRLSINNFILTVLYCGFCWINVFDLLFFLLVLRTISEKKEVSGLIVDIKFVHYSKTSAAKEKSSKNNLKVEVRKV